VEGSGEGRDQTGCRAAVNTIRAYSLLYQGHAARGGTRFFLDFGFAIGTPAPKGEGKAILNGPLQVIVGFHIVSVALAKSQRLVVKRLLDFRQQPLDGGRQAGERGADLSLPARAVAARKNGGLFGDVLGTEFHAQRDSAHLPIIKFPAGALTFAFIESHTDVGM